MKKLLLFTLLFTITLCQDQHSSQQNSSSSTLTKSQIWGFGILAGIGISLIGFLAAIILLIAKKYCNENIFINIIKFLFALAFGALIGDAIIHILSQVYANQDINGNIASAIFIASILIFIFIDRILHAYGVSHTHWIDDGKQCQHKHKHNNKLEQNNQSNKVQSQQYKSNKNQQNKQKQSKNNKNKIHNHKHHGNQPCITLKQNIQDNQIQIQNQNQRNNKNSKNKNKQMKIFPLDSHNTMQNSGSLQNLQQNNKNQHQQQNKQQQQQQNSKYSLKNCLKSYKNKSTTGYMNLIGSLIHNFIDGLALGVVFSTGNPLQIIPTIIAIFAHEIPRQLGDVVILLKSQFSSKQTIICNGTINLLSLIGVIIGLAVQGLSQIVQMYIMVSVAGNFIYIAADIWQNLFRNSGENAKLLNGIQVIGAAVGIGAMFGIKFIQGHEHQ